MMAMVGVVQITSGTTMCSTTTYTSSGTRGSHTSNTSPITAIIFGASNSSTGGRHGRGTSEV